MSVNEPKSFAQDESDVLAEDVMYWANLFRATPNEVKSALETLQEHPEPEDPTAVPRAMSDDPSEPHKPA